jgi:hypothetical protein
MPRHDKVKINGANGQTGGKNCSSTFVLTAFVSFGLFNMHNVLDVVNTNKRPHTSCECICFVYYKFEDSWKLCIETATNLKQYIHKIM